jgi:hypothetical protein
MSIFTYVCVLQSEANPNGSTLVARMIFDRAFDITAEVPHTPQWKPWRIKTYVGQSDQERAETLERYLKSAGVAAIWLR